MLTVLDNNIVSVEPMISYIFKDVGTSDDPLNQRGSRALKWNLNKKSYGTWISWTPQGNDDLQDLQTLSARFYWWCMAQRHWWVRIPMRLWGLWVDYRMKAKYGYIAE